MSAKRRYSERTKAKRFFYAHAGYSVRQGETKRQGRERSAAALADANVIGGN